MASLCATSIFNALPCSQQRASEVFGLWAPCQLRVLIRRFALDARTVAAGSRSNGLPIDSVITLLDFIPLVASAHISLPTTLHFHTFFFVPLSCSDLHPENHLRVVRCGVSLFRKLLNNCQSTRFLVCVRSIQLQKRCRPAGFLLTS